MCALFGFLDCGKRIPLKALQKLVQALANASEVREDLHPLVLLSVAISSGVASNPYNLANS
jgi:hypothetical protein